MMMQLALFGFKLWRCSLSVAIDGSNIQHRAMNLHPACWFLIRILAKYFFFLGRNSKTPP
jgi:hypothetical protein